ncbi:hypothetical protein F4781DRAFT_117491 [Annulohypoxylon bovei var. microspora]|nr:hypothetical protein F4781DRAFT_117491 [Annulohypoxylon bovei var. microspora]
MTTIPESTQTDEAHDAVPTTEFRVFLKLPVEIQNMIWNSYRSQMNVRHYFSLNNSGERLYAATDVKSRGFINRLATPKDDDLLSVFHYLRKIQFVGDVTVQLKEKDHHHGATTNLHYAGKDLRISKPVVYVDFEYDTFCFDYSAYENYSPGGCEWEWFRFLRLPINRRKPPRLAQDNWIFKVRNIALFIPETGIEGSEWDYMVLEEMKLLKKVWLISPLIIELDYLTPTIMSTWSLFCPFLLAQDVAQDRWDKAQAHCEKTEDNLRKKLNEYNINAKLVITTQAHPNPKSF